MFICAQTVDNGAGIVYNKVIRYLTLSFREDSAGKVLPKDKTAAGIRGFFGRARMQVRPDFLLFDGNGGSIMANRVAVMGIIVENRDSTEPLNSLLHEYGEYIIGRMGIPYRERGISIISIAIDAPQNLISALSGKIGNLDGVSVKTAYSHIEHND